MTCAPSDRTREQLKEDAEDVTEDAEVVVAVKTLATAVLHGFGKVLGPRKTHVALLALATLGTAAAAATAPPSPLVGLTNASEIRVTAECTSELTPEHIRYSCEDGRSAEVEITLGDLHIWADAVDYFDEPTADMKRARRVEAKGNVVFMSGEQRLSGDTLKMDLESGKGVLTDVRGYVQPGVFFEAAMLERLAATTYRAKGARFTSCFQPSPRWSFSAARATIKLDDHVFATAVNFKVLGVPTPILLPAFYYPIQKDQRATGLLAPTISKGQPDGWTFGTGFFWAMGRSVDQTVLYDYATDAASGFHRATHELRYLRPSDSSGTFSSSYQLGKNRSRNWSLTWNAAEALPAKFRAVLGVSESSSTLFQQQQNLEDLTQSTNRTQFVSLNLSRRIGRNNLQMLADTRDTSFVGADGPKRIEHHPQVSLSRTPQRIGRTGFLWSYRATGEYLGNGNEEGTDRYSRFDLAPQLSRPLSTSFLQLTPRITAHYNRYGGFERPDDPSTPDVTESGFTHETVDRHFVETSLEMRGPKVFRVFHNPSGVYTDRIKHQIEPEVTWTFRSRVDYGPLSTTGNIPQLDNFDRLVGMNRFIYGLTQTLIAKRPGAAGRTVPYNFLTWQVTQKYYPDPATSRLDSETNSPVAVDTEGERFTPVFSNLRLRPTARFNASVDLQYDVKRSGIQSESVSGALDYPRVSLSGTWTRYYKLRADGNPNTLAANTVSGHARLTLIPNKVSLQGDGTYDFKPESSTRVLQQSFSIRYDVQCCGIMIQHTQRKLGADGKPVNRWTFQFQLANIGSVGTMGDENGNLFGTKR